MEHSGFEARQLFPTVSIHVLFGCDYVPYNAKISLYFPSHTTWLMVLIMVFGQAEAVKFSSIIIMILEDTTMELNNQKLPQHIHDDKNGLNYTLCGDYYLPDLGVELGYSLGKYGMMRMQYLEEHRPGLYTRLLLSGKLNEDLHQADVQAQPLLDTMIPQIAKEAGVTEQMKMTDQLRWVEMMNAIKNQVEEIIWNEIVYQ